MQVKVEFFGIPRARAGVAETIANGTTLGEIVQNLGKQFPLLGETCFDGAALKPGYIVNFGGERFVTDPETSLSPNDIVLLLSLDAGG